jgi:hypothetical protein
MNVGDVIKVPTTEQTVQNDLHRLRSAISQHKRLYQKPDIAFKITTYKKNIVCERVS